MGKATAYRGELKELNNPCAALVFQHSVPKRYALDETQRIAIILRQVLSPFSYKCLRFRFRGASFDSAQILLTVGLKALVPCLWFVFPATRMGFLEVIGISIYRRELVRTSCQFSR